VVVDVTAVDATPTEVAMMVVEWAHGLEVPLHFHEHKWLVAAVVDPHHQLLWRMLVVVISGLVDKPLLNLNPIKEVVAVVGTVVAGNNNNPFLMHQSRL
jgi:hypothetical protein